MLTRIKRSLTLRIFLITCCLLVTVCMVTYGAIAYLTPITYTSILTSELNQRTSALVANLSAVYPSDCEKLLDSFCQETGAYLLLSDAHGRTLYQTMAFENVVYYSHVEDTESISEGSIELSEDGIVEESAAPEGLEMIDVLAPAAPADPQVAVTEEAIFSANEQTFSFRDGTQATLAVFGGEKAVNQASEAMKRIFPFLLVLILAISLLTSFFYARFITRPIKEIGHIAEGIADLDFSVRWKRDRLDEIGVLGTRLNMLSDNLSSALADLRDANARLQQDIDRERELEQQRAAFFSAASHELKTPVTILKGQLSGMLAQIGVYQDREKYLARALEVTGRMESLIREILIISRIDGGCFSLDKDSVNLSEMMEQLIELDHELMEQKAQHMVAEITPNVIVRGNRNLLSNALDNVLMNAILYSPEKADIHIRVDKKGFFVENTGVFLPEEAFSRVFTSFYRVEQSRNRRSGGSGLGLYLVKRILDLHHILCNISNSERGVIFSAYLPTEPFI